MYVDGDILSVIVESEDSGLEMQADDTENYTEDCFYYFSEEHRHKFLPMISVIRKSL